ncbi:MAG: thioesterase family protein [Ignavibacteriaceae bacterium]
MLEINTNNFFDIKISVEKSDIDLLNHVNNTVYLRWAQDVAVAHWRSLATEEQQANITWVVTRHEIDYKLSAKLGDEIIARTWVGKATEVLFERFTEIICVKDKKILAKARTLWCPISTKTGRIVRVDADVRKRFSVSYE